jgi:hypothetical protein
VTSDCKNCYYSFVFARLPRCVDCGRGREDLMTPSRGAETMRDGADFDRQFRSDSNLIKRIDEHGEGLTEWEVAFVERCLEWLDSHKCLTDAMRAKAEQIDEERVK